MAGDTSCKSLLLEQPLHESKDFSLLGHCCAPELRKAPITQQVLSKKLLSE